MKFTTILGMIAWTSLCLGTIPHDSFWYWVAAIAGNVFIGRILDKEVNNQEE